MKAIMLAAGKSTRLNPLTNALPKCLLPVGGKTILDHQIENLIASDIDELVIVVGFYKEKILDHLAQKKYPIKIIPIENTAYETNGPISSLLFAREYIQGPLIFFHCDVLFGSAAIPALLGDMHDSVLLYRGAQWDAEAGKIIVEASTNRVTELGKHIEQNRASGEYLQIAKFGSAFCDRLRAVLDERTRVGRDGYTIDAFNDVVHGQSIEAIGLPFDGVALEIDTVEDYEHAQHVWIGS